MCFIWVKLYFEINVRFWQFEVDGDGVDLSGGQCGPGGFVDQGNVSLQYRTTLTLSGKKLILYCIVIVY